MKIYNNTSNLVDMLSKISNLSKIEMRQLENALIERTVENISSEEVYIVCNYAFYGCTNLTTVSFPACTSIGGSAFLSCTNLTIVSFPACKTIGTSAFGDCTNLTTASFPACTTIGDSAFYNCSSLATVSFPACKTIGNGAFGDCTNLTTVSFPVCTSIGGHAFYYCSKLSSIYLGSSKICTLANSNAFSRTSIWSNTGSIFVQSSLVASYKQATNWVYFSSRIYANR